MKYLLARSGVLVPASLATWRCQANAPAVITASKVLDASGAPWEPHAKNRKGRGGIVRPRAGILSLMANPVNRMKAPPQVNPLYPNQPPGMTPFAALDMSGLPAAHGNPGVVLGDWFTQQAATPAQITLATDPTVPQGAPNVLSYGYQAGTPSGFSTSLFGASNSLPVVGTEATANGLGVTLRAAVTTAHDIMVIFVGKGTASLPSTCTDSLNNTYTLQASQAATGGNTNIAVFTAPVTTGGTPVITVGSTSLTNTTVTAFGMQGLSSATASVTGSAHETNANPMTVSLSPAALSTALVIAANCNTDAVTTLEQAMQLAHYTVTSSNMAFGLLVDQAAGTYACGANFGTPDTDTAVVVLWFPSAAVAHLGGRLYQGWAIGATESTGTEYQEVYESLWFKMPSADFEVQFLGQKTFGYWGVGDMHPSGGAVQLYNAVQNPLTVGPFDVNVGQPVTTMGPIEYNIVVPSSPNRTFGQNIAATAMTCNVWHRLETHLKLNSTTSTADGVLEMWLDGQLISRYTDIQYTNPSDAHGFWGRRLDAIWGSQGTVTKTRNDTVLFGYHYISGVLK